MARSKSKPHPKRRPPEHLWRPDIIPQGETGSFLIESESDPGGTYYVIELEAFNGKGACTCDDYICRVRPYRDRGIEPVHRDCKHIRACFSHVGRELIARIIKTKKGRGS